MGWEQLIQVGILFRRTLLSWKNGLRETSCNSLWTNENFSIRLENFRAIVQAGGWRSVLHYSTCGVDDKGGG